MSSFFVTGTGTGVGKTVVTSLMCTLTGAQPMKPVQTGSLEADDLSFVEEMTGRIVDRDASSPFRFEEPLAPKVAAERAGTTIDPSVIVKAFHALSASGEVVVEGAGGLLVEISAGYTMAELAADLGLPLVVACRPGLGTLNETALTLEAARSRSLDVAGLVVCGWPARPGLAERTNPFELARMAPILGVIPIVDGLDTERREAGILRSIAADCLSPLLGGRFDSGAFLASL